MEDDNSKMELEGDNQKGKLQKTYYVERIVDYNPQTEMYEVQCVDCPQAIWKPRNKLVHLRAFQEFEQSRLQEKDDPLPETARRPKPDDYFPVESILLKETIICKRKDSISTIIETVNDKKTMLIRSPPFTGKTSIAHLLTDELKNLNKKVFSLTFLPFAYTPQLTTNEYFRKETGKDFLGWANEDVYFVLDELQVLYQKKDDQLWIWMKEIMGKAQNAPKVIAFATYGSQKQKTTRFTTPCKFGAELGIDLVFATQNEVSEYVKAFNKISNGLIPNKLIPVLHGGYSRTFRIYFHSFEIFDGGSKYCYIALLLYTKGDDISVVFYFIDEGNLSFTRRSQFKRAF
jgi:hypothetical protein